MAKTTINGDAQVTGVATFDGNITAASNVTISGEVQVTGTTTFDGKVRVNTLEINGSGEDIDKFDKEVLTIATFEVSGHATNVQTITVTGVIESDFVIPAKPVNTDNEIVVIGQSVDDAVVLKFNNTSNSPATSTATSINVLIISFS